MKVAIIGCGVMGRTLVRGLLESGHRDIRIGTRRTATAEQAAREFDVPAGTDNLEAVAGAEVVVLCVKPKNVLKVAAALAPRLPRAASVVSIVAGVTLADLAAVLPEGQPLVRAMPNTPCQVGTGMTVVSPGPHASAAQVEAARTLFSSVGRALVLDEEHMDAVTGLSASGPAFLYLVIESLTDGGVMNGLPRQVALELAAQTTLGAAAMVLSTGRHPADLKDAVTTPAGCTISALLRLEDGGLRSTLARGVQEAARAAAGLRRQPAAAP